MLGFLFSLALTLLMALIRPGTNIVVRETSSRRGANTDTGVWFVAGLTEKGLTGVAHKIESMSDYTRLLGQRVSYGILYDALETFFAEGGAVAYVSRLAGPAAANSFVVLNDAGAAATLRVEAKGPGDWGNALNVAVTAGDAGGEFKLVITHDTLGTLETSPSLVDKAAAFNWAQNSLYIVLVDQASLNDPAVVAAQSLAGGADDRASITDAGWETGINIFGKDLGPGQVSMPGRTTQQAHVDLLEHAVARNRNAILDAIDTATAATHITSASNARTANARYGALFAGWLKIPGITPGTTRLVPPSALVAGRIAFMDALGSPNVPAAGVNGESTYAIGINNPVLESDRESLNNVGVNVIRMQYGVPRIYGWRSLANPVTETQWLPFGNVRLLMEIAALADEIGEQFLFAEMDGQRRTVNRFGAALTGMLIPYWEEGSLYGLTPGEAFAVDVGTSVNTPATMANNELRAILSLRMSPFAEMVTIEIVKVPITEGVV